jgi:hypothetical protein
MPKKFYCFQNKLAVGRTEEMIYVSTPKFTEANESKVREIFAKEITGRAKRPKRGK